MKTIPQALISIFFVAATLFSTTVTQGFISAGPWPSLKNHTLEALTAHSPLIVTATVRSHTFVDHRWHLTLDTIVLLKSPPGFPVTPFDITVGGYEDHKPLPAPGSQILVFLSSWSYHRGSDWSANDIVLLAPSSPSLNAYPIRDLTLRPLTDPAHILSLVRAELQRSPPTTTIESFNVYPFDLLNLPADDRLLPAAHQWVHSSDPLARYLAVRVFLAHVDPADTPLLYPLLDDPFFADYPFGLSPWSAHEYLIRQAAAKALIARGAPFSPTPLFIPRTDLYHPVSLLKVALLFLAAFVAYVLARRVYLRHRPRPTRKRSLLNALTSLSFILASCALVLAYRSNYTADDLVYARHGTLLNITSIQGYAYLEVATHWPGSTPLVHLAVTPDATDRTPNSLQASFRNGFGTDSLWNCYVDDFKPRPWGFGCDTTHQVNTFPFFPRASTRPVCPGISMGVYYGYFVALALLIPILRLLSLAFKNIRQSRRLRRLRLVGLCPNCSYDLRAHKPGDRCPECGTAIPLISEGKG